MPSPIYQYVVNLVVSLAIRRGPGVFVNVPVREHRALKHQIFRCSEVNLSNSIIITILMETLQSNCWFENNLSPHFCIKIS